MSTLAAPTYEKHAVRRDVPAVEVVDLTKEFRRKDRKAGRFARRRMPALKHVTFTNPTDEPARILAISNKVEPEVVVYPELGKVAVATRSPFEVPEGDDKGIVAMFDIPSSD
jgi:uncharacterized cupin superfamily protein